MNDATRLVPVWQPEPWSARAGLEKVWNGIRDRYARKPISTVLIGIVLVILLAIERPFLQPYLLIARIYFPAVLIAVAFSLGARYVFLHARLSHRMKVLVGAGMLALLAIVLVFGKTMHDYTSQYYRYQTLTIVDLKGIEPETGYERILPLHGVHTLARERMNETEDPTEPDLVRIGNGYRWTMAIEPASIWGRFAYDIHEFLSVPADEPTPDLSRRNPEKVHFDLGEALFFSRNIKTCTRLNFGLWRSASYEPDNIFRIKDDAGRWVQVVSLVRWTGWIFPRPEFGGVQVIEQGGTNFISRNFWGCGRWIKPEEIARHPFLVGQNLMPYAATRYMAESLRFQAGFLGPLKISKTGDLRIADMPDDINQQPFTLYFRMPDGTSKLYQYFGLEPRDKDKQGLSTSLFVPADGIGPKYAIKHYDRRIPIGVTAVADQVRASKKNYDWSRNAVVEVRPYIHKIADSNNVVAPRFAWMVTVVAVKNRKPGVPIQFTSGSDPEIALVDAYWNKVVWVNSQKPASWPDELKVALGSLWSQ